MVALTGFGLFDQFSTYFTPPYKLSRRDYASDADFGRRMEAALPAGAMVFEMPRTLFPEGPPVVALGSYEPLRPALHTRTLRWSGGAIRGREAAAWQDDAAALTAPDFVERIAVAGFRGIYLDRAGFADGGAATEEELSRLLGVEPIVSATGRQAFYDMTAYVDGLRSRFTDAEWEQKRVQALGRPP